LMGYNFALEKINQLTEIAKGQATALSMVWNNQGVAPFYYNWPLEFSLIDASGNVAYTQAVDGNITSWLPGRHSVNVEINVPGTVPAGNYTLAVAILDKDSLVPGIKLAIDGAREDLRYPLYTVAVTGEDVPGGDVPGGDVPGGDVPGGDVPGGDTPGGDVPGGDDSGNGGNSGNGGSSSGGSSSGGSSSGGSSSGGSTSGSTSESTDGTTITPVRRPSRVPALVTDTETTDVITMDQLMEALEDAEDGASFTVDMEGESVVSATILETIAQRGVDVTFVFDNGVEWHINASDIGDGELRDIDFTVTLHTNNIVREIVDAILGNNNGFQFNIRHHGEFGLKARLKLPVGKEHKGRIADLYYFNEETAELELAGSDTVTEDGTASYDFTHASDYLIVLSGDVVEDGTGEDTGVVTPEDGATDEEALGEDNTAVDTPAQDGGNNSLWIIIAIIALVLIAAGVCVYRFVFAQKGENGDE